MVEKNGLEDQPSVAEPDIDITEKITNNMIHPGNISIIIIKF